MGAKTTDQPAGNPQTAGHRRTPYLWGLLSLVVAVALAEATALWLQKSATPSEQDWQRAVTALDGQRKAGEPILAAPFWVQPLAYRYLGQRIDLALAGVSDVDRFARVWQLSIRGAQHRYLAARQPSQTLQFGGVTLTRYDTAKPAAVLFDFRENIAQANVETVGKITSSCRWSGDRHRCRFGWSWVGSYLAEVDYRPYRCIYAHPSEGERLRISFPAVPIGGSLRVYTGIDDFDNRKRSTADVELSISIAGSPAKTIRHRNEWPWHSETIDTSSHQGQRQPVRFEVSATPAYARAFCFHAETRR
ncbi:MAG: hypothetical protein H6707_04995 [Deltaproteobacteria bacterium]|nr:hypothetical protein [Deltaproteobacteria bacterium]